MEKDPHFENTLNKLMLRSRAGTCTGKSIGDVPYCKDIRDKYKCIEHDGN